jgi:hypothetical protein
MEIAGQARNDEESFKETFYFVKALRLFWIPACAGMTKKKATVKIPRRFALLEQWKGEVITAHSDSDNRVIAIFSSPHFDTASCFDLFKEKERGPV